MNILIWLVVGGVIGWIASLIVGTDAQQGVLLNVIWFVFAGWYIALSHLLIAIAEAITIIGLPFAFKDLQLAGFALAPIGKTVVRR